MTSTHQNAVLTWNEPSEVRLRGTLVVVPGRGESPQIYERFGKRLASDAYRVHVITAPTESVDLAREQLTSILDEAPASEATPRVVVGSDTGAAFAAHLAAQGELSSASALILAGLPTGPAGKSAGNWESELDLRTACPAHRGRISQDGVRPGALFDEVPAEWLDPSIPSRITVPTLGIHGRDDEVIARASARSWYADVPQAEFVVVRGGQHDALNDHTHRSVAATIVLFLERLRYGAGVPPIAITETRQS